MVTYVVRVAGREVEVRIDPRRTGRLTLDGREVTVDCAQVGTQPIYSVLIDGRSYELLVHEAPGEGLRISLGGRIYEVEVEDERTRALAAVAGRRGADGETPIKAPMPGLVLSVAVSPGDQVAAHQRLLVLEAMKMENEVGSPRTGTVREVRVKAGQAVEAGELLAIVE
jgi:biotin carboxyl carrier protein